MIEAHRGPIEYDWRTRFHLPLSSVGQPGEMTWSEAVRLSRILRADPSSALAAALVGWSHPVSREALILMDQWDLDAAVASGKRRAPRHPGRPYDNDSTTTRYGKTGGRSQAEIAAILNAHGHDIKL